MARWSWCAVFGWMIMVGVVQTAAAEPSDYGTAADEHLMALEQSHRQSLDEMIEAFESQRFSAGFLERTDAVARRELLGAIHAAARQAGGVGIDQRDDAFILTLDGKERFIVTVTLQSAPPWRIDDLSIEKAPALPVLSRDGLEQQIDALMAEGQRSGVVFVSIDGATLVSKAYGLANESLNVSNRMDTIFGVGSRPIDFTSAAVYRLADQQKLDLDDALSRYYPEAPADRAQVTIRQMLTGRSGLPDFPANGSDADPDLTWIDRAEFERRTMAVPLLFGPGEGRAHSHWAFGVLAAIIEKVTDTPYATFLKQEFFEPAGMTRTGDYGDHGGFSLEDFAVGGGKQVGLPNIPPNWGPTSWLVMGSGGMYSTLGDLQRFYRYLLSDKGLSEEHRSAFLGQRAQLDGSERGFELFSYTDDDYQDQAYVFLNSGGGPDAILPIGRPLAELLSQH